MIVIIHLQRGIPSKRESSTRIDYVPALCTHRPSLLPIEWISELQGFRRIWRKPALQGELNQTCSFRGSKSRNKVVCENKIREKDTFLSCQIISEALAAHV